MDLALIAIIITAVVLLLQIISLALIAGMRKSLRAPKEVRTVPAAPQDRFERRPQGDFRRHEKRPFPEQRQRPQPQSPAPQAAPSPAVVDPVEKSLRDINMRLKNAERDQESARRKLQENLIRGEQPPRGRDGNDRGERYDRGDRGGRGGRDRHRGGHNRDQRRDNWQDRNRGPQSQSSPLSTAPASAPSGDAPQFEKRDFAPAAPQEQQTASPYIPIQQTPVMEQKPMATPDIVASDYGSEGNLEHGRKVIINRRPLRDEASAPASSNNEAATQASPQVPMGPEEETTVGNSGDSSSEITFGRR